MLPQGFPERMLHLLGEAEFAEFLASYERPRSAGLRLNPQAPAGWRFSPVLRGAGPWEPNGYYVCEGSRPGLHPWHDAGAYYLQGAERHGPGACWTRSPASGVLDLCAAPGGKTTQLAAAMQGRGLLVCNEIHPRRAQVLASNIERLGIPNALVLSEHPARLAQRFPGYFDRILVDAPAPVRHVPEGGGRRDGLERGDRGHVRRAAAGDPCLRGRNAGPGGRLVYSTCTFSPEENEGVISASFLHAHPAFSRRAGRGPGSLRRGRTGSTIPRPVWSMPSASGRIACAVRATLPPSCAAMRTWRTAGCSHGTPRSAPGSGRRLLRSCTQPLPDGVPVCFWLRVLSGPGGNARPFRPARAARWSELGELRRDRFSPAHALALWLHTYPQTADFPAYGPEIAAYLRGETLHGTQRGWTL